MANVTVLTVLCWGGGGGDDDGATIQSIMVNSYMLCSNKKKLKKKKQMLISNLLWSVCGNQKIIFLFIAQLTLLFTGRIIVFIIALSAWAPYSTGEKKQKKLDIFFNKILFALE